MNRFSWPGIVVLVCLFISIFSIGFSQAQQTIVQGKVIDANSGDPIPFANVVFKGSTVGMTTDFEGNFMIKTSNPVDSVAASYIGYKSKAKHITRGIKQTVNFQLVEEATSLQEIVISAGENPAWEILRKVMRNKNKNDKRRLTAYEYDTYTKIEVDVDKISDELRQRKVMRKITQVLDSVERIAGEDGKPVLPVFITESVSKLYFRDNPMLKKEIILKSKITGLGVEDGTSTIQLVGSSFQEYNFYENWLNILSKEFISPIADGWRLYYDYDLTDSTYFGGDYCYRLDFNPKSPQDLAFSGTMWITKEDFALRQIDATVGVTANLNFVERIKIQQELLKTDFGPWLPVKNRVLIDVGELTSKSAGMLAKFYTSNKNFVVNKPQEPRFYERAITVAEDALIGQDNAAWDTLRHEPLSETEKNVYKMIDTLKNIPVVKTYTDIVKFVLDGYIKVGPKIKVGPYATLLSWNNIEGFRVQSGFKTTYQFSKKYVFGGQFAYGFTDDKLKYSVFGQQILDRNKWTTITFRAKKDLMRLGVDSENLGDNPLFLAATRWGYFRRGYYMNDTRATIQREFFKGFSQKVSLQYWTFDPTYNFGYFENPNSTTPIFDEFQTTEVSFESRFARDELFIQDDNERISLGTNKSPVITLRYTHGIKGIFGSDFDYDKVRMNISKRIKTGPLGVGYITLTGEYVFNTLPYPLLSLHLGNQSFLYSSITYNLMNYGEFVSDHYASLHYRQYLEGFLLNRIPLIQKLKWRLLATGNVVMGGMRESNRNLISQYSPTGEETLKAGYFTGKPYVELGYGVENIFKFLRVDFVHRVSYLDNPNVRKFGVLFTAQLQL